MSPLDDLLKKYFKRSNETMRTAGEMHPDETLRKIGEDEERRLAETMRDADKPGRYHAQKAREDASNYVKWMLGRKR